MEELLLLSLQRRHEKLKEAISTAENCIKQAETGVDQNDVTAAQITLRSVLQMFTTYFEKVSSGVSNLDVNLMKQYFEDQLKAEDSLVRFEIILATCAKGVTGNQSKLPKLELSRFNGNILNWVPFWDKFEANVHSKNISDVEKFSYLMSVLEGVALKAVEGLAVTNSNYEIAIKILKDRYGKQQLVMDAHNDALHKLKRAEPTATDCRQTLDTIEKHIRVLESMGDNVDGSHMRVIIMDKFPDNIRYQANLQTVNDYSVVSIRSALNIVISSLERSEVNVTPGTSSTVVGKPTCSVEALHVNADNQKNSRKRKWSQGREQQKFSKQPKSKGLVVKKPKYQCAFCNDLSHYSEDCPKFKSYRERVLCLKNKCFICFKEGHRASKCFRKKSCVHCHKMHNRALCPNKTKKPEQGENPNACEIKNPTIAFTNHTLNFLQTAVVQIKTAQNQILPCRLLLDSGSQRSYMSTHLAKKCNIVPDSEDHLIVYTFGASKPKECVSPSAEITLITKRGIERIIRVNIVPHITNRIPIYKFVTPGIDIIADDETAGETVDLLIGNDLYFSFMKGDHVKLQDELYFVDSQFGWIMSGHLKHKEEGTLSMTTYCQNQDTECTYYTEPDLPLRDIDIKFLWTLESIGIVDSPKATREEDVVRYFNETTVYNQGRYEVKWPWIEYPPELPTNLGLAFGRLTGLLRRLDQESIKEYEAILKEQLAAKIIEEVEPVTSGHTHPVHYLPHHIVKQEGKRGRIVYDASAKLKGQKSLNECLYSGPCMLEDLTALLLKFRIGKIGLTADIEKAFLQVGLQEEDRDVTRFIWVKDPAKELTNDNILHFRFCRVPFGIISSPFLLTATIRFHMARTNEALLKEVACNCYVDNLVMSVDSSEKAEQIYRESKKVFNNISMVIRDWASNNESFSNTIPQNDKVKNQDEVKILGLMWNLKDDTLQLNASKISLTHINPESTTKKDVLRTLARFYDPCGFVSPLILSAKLLFQELCIRKLKWESVIPEDLQERWGNILKDLEKTKVVKVPRYVGSDMTDNTSRELHCFVDASKDAYAAVTYLHVGGKKTELIMSKARVTPIEDKDNLKIPRLELLACLIGSRLLKYITSNLEIPIDNIFLWTDSQIVLAWIRSNKLLPPFVARRVNEIKNVEKALRMQLRYVNTKENPADIATRPETWQPKQNMWFHGPNFLAHDKKSWTHQDWQTKAEEILCLAGEDLNLLEGPEMTSKGYEDDETIQRLIDVHEDEEVLDIPFKDNMSEIKNLQKKHYPDEVMGKENCLSRNLGLFLDVDGVLRCRGRLSNANWPYDKRYPILLPKDSSFTCQVIKRAHESNYHIGVSHTLSIIREKYWIPQGRAQVQKVLKKCPQCVKYGGGPYRIPAAPALPPERVNYSTPFTFTGLDYLGPVFVSTKNDKEKRWICLFTCLAVRAIHLELVKDLTAEECLLALRRFAAARGVPQVIMSDNAQQFKLTSEVLTSSYCEENSIKWKFITQLAPWQGGFYERLVALVKHCLKRTLDKHMLSDNQIHTVVKEVESVLNTRPLTVVGSELEEVLRPADFLTLGKCLEICPTFTETTVTGTHKRIDLIDGWKRGYMILDEYKKMFMNQYLPSLRERPVHTPRQPRVKSKKSVEIGDVVQIKDSSNSRTNWKVGKITSLINSRDGVCRVAKVKVGNTEFTRSVGHLYPLEVEAYENENYRNDGDVLTTEKEDRSGDPHEPLLLDAAGEVPMEMKDNNAEISDHQQEVQVEPEDPECVVPQEVLGSDPPYRLFESPPEGAEIESRKSSGPPCGEDSEQMSVPLTIENSMHQEEPSKRRAAAVRARQKIAEWTSHLLMLL